MDKLYYDCIDEHITGEEWKQHPIYTNYEGSSLGRIRNKNTGRIKKQCFGENGRLKITLWNKCQAKTIYVSRFILECFSMENKQLECDHIDSNFLNNKLQNLRWVSHEENCNNKASILKRIKKEKLDLNTKKVKCYDIDNKSVYHFKSIKEAIKTLGLKNKSSYASISHALNGVTKTAYGYKWEYENEEIFSNEFFRKHPFLEIEVSNFGRIRRIGNGNKHYRILSGHKNKQGYVYVRIDNKQYSIHRLVAETFIPNNNNFPFVNHINGNRSLNVVENLEWCDQKMNINSPATYRKKAKMVDLCDLNGIFIKTYNSINSMCRELNLPSQYVIECCKGKREHYKGYKFNYNKEKQYEQGI